MEHATTPAAETCTAAHGRTAFTLKGANALVSPTWHRLHMNDVDIDIPGGLTLAAPATIEVPEGLAVDPASIDGAFAAQPNLESGMGPKARAFIAQHAGVHAALATKPHERVAAPVVVRLEGADGCLRAAAVDIVAAEDSTLDLVIISDSPHAGTGVLGLTLRIIAETGSHVTVHSLQTLDDGWVMLEDSGLHLDDDARVEVRHTVLGARGAYVGLAANLEGTRSGVRIDARYAGHGEQQLDFNYLIRHRGIKTTSKLIANGVLMDESKKTLRGTIDLMKGCKGADGYESETVLLVNEQVDNKSIPIILCTEDDVAGNHGATIGHVKPTQLAYLASRGLSLAQAERLFARATFEEAAFNASDASAAKGVARVAASLGIVLDVSGEGYQQ